MINTSRGHSFKEVFLAAIAFAIAATPTGLPAMVTAILSRGTQTLAKANAIMKRLRSTETLGSASAINSDKTGTLTTISTSSRSTPASRSATRPTSLRSPRSC